MEEHKQTLRMDLPDLYTLDLICEEENQSRNALIVALIRKEGTRRKLPKMPEGWKPKPTPKKP
jgi:hypothetical protein